MTNIQLTDTEENLLNKGSKYNMGISPKRNIKQLVYETENVIRQVKDTNQQEAIRYLATKNIQQIMSTQNTTNKEYKEQIRTIKEIQQKLTQHKAAIAEADKGKSLVIIYKEDLNDKVKSFIENNNITELKTDPTQKCQRTVQKHLKQCKIIIDPIKRKYIHQMNPQAPKLNAKIKFTNQRHQSDR
jgi:Tfp pilus assembly protein FimT